MGGQCCKQDCMRGENNTLDPFDQHSVMSSSKVDVALEAPKTEEQRQAEKARLKFMVRSFASSAVRGTSCEVVDVETGKVEAAQYAIDRTLRMFTLQPSGPPETSNLKETTFNISKITDVLKADEMHLIKEGIPAGLAGLSEASRKRLVVIRHLDDGSKPCLLGFLEADAVVRETFITCINILRLYCEASVSALT